MTRKTSNSMIVPVLRDMTPDDIDAVFALELEIFPDAWPRTAFDEIFVEDTWGATVAVVEGEIVGYACHMIVAGEAHLANMAVAPAWRRKLVAKQLLDRILKFALDDACEIILLEVRPSNEAARRFYAKAGFVELYRRPGYYRHPVEDAVVMLRHLQTVRDDE